MQTSTHLTPLALILTDDMIQRRIIATLIPKIFDVKKTGVSNEAINALNITNRKTIAFLDVRTFNDDGAALCQLLKNNFNNIVIVLFSGLSQQGKLSHLIKNTVAQYFLVLPIDKVKIDNILIDFQLVTESEPKKPLRKSSNNFIEQQNKNNEKLLRGKIKPGSILNKLNKKYKGIFDGIWQDTDRFFPK